MSHAKLRDQRGDEAQIIGLTQDESALVIHHNDESFEVPFRRIREEGDHLLYLGSFDELNAIAPEHIVVPVIEEQANIKIRKVESGKVRVKKSVRERTETIPTRLSSESFHIERLQKMEVSAKPFESKTEGDVTIIPVQEEFFVLEKRYRLLEEIRIEKRVATREEQVSVKLRTEEVSIERKKL